MGKEPESQRVVLGRIRDKLLALCREQDALLVGQYRFLLERVDALLLLTET
jgi:hypothetical protein